MRNKTNLSSRPARCLDSELSWFSYRSGVSQSQQNYSVAIPPFNTIRFAWEWESEMRIVLVTRQVIASRCHLVVKIRRAGRLCSCTNEVGLLRGRPDADLAHAPMRDDLGCAPSHEFKGVGLEVGGDSQFLACHEITSLKFWALRRLSVEFVVAAALKDLGR
ncbi:hypothetical protein TNCT_481341 [Trichonephila clavata]|uniref:Uncharacterized protein n=1 Tax=Trichonephila clavata TaxID=2740835 RepID=A0A8X6L9Q8_TRICU|nr:hypothetical protein TNCT_481341 [Trichonephila clavata]